MCAERSVGRPREHLQGTGSQPWSHVGTAAELKDADARRHPRGSDVTGPAAAWASPADSSE